MLKNIIFFLLLIVVISCSLEHSNPLDPKNSGIQAPNEVTNIIVTKTAQNHVNITWASQPAVDGYFIYRSFSEDGQFDRLEILAAGTTTYLDLITITNYHTWYKLSAYIIVAGDSLEGYRSAPKTWNN